MKVKYTNIKSNRIKLYFEIKESLWIAILYPILKSGRPDFANFITKVVYSGVHQIRDPYAYEDYNNLIPDLALRDLITYVFFGKL